MLSSQPFLITFGISIVVSIWIYTTYFRNKVPKSFATTLHLFTRQRKVYPVHVENRNGLMFPEVGPGFVEVNGTSILKRYGRVWKTCATDKEAEAGRSRSVIYVTRENDPTPFSVALGRVAGYQGEQVDHATFADLSNLNQREAAATATSEGSTKEAFVNKLMIALIIAVSAAVASWALYFVLTVIKGDQG